MYFAILLRMLEGGEKIDQGVAGRIRVTRCHIAAVGGGSAQWDNRQEPFRFERGIPNHEPLLVNPRTWRRAQLPRE